MISPRGLRRRVIAFEATVVGDRVTSFAPLYADPLPGDDHRQHGIRLWSGIVMHQGGEPAMYSDTEADWVRAAMADAWDDAGRPTAGSA